MGPSLPANVTNKHNNSCCCFSNIGINGYDLFLHSPWMLEPPEAAATAVVSTEAWRLPFPHLLRQSSLSRTAQFQNVAVSSATLRTLREVRYFRAA